MMYCIQKDRKELVEVTRMTQDSIREILSNSKEEGLKKQISLMIDERNLQMTDIVVEQFKQLSGGKYVTSRNNLIELALEEYLQAAADVLLQDHFINIEEMVTQEEKVREEKNDNDYDLALFPARNKGFEEVFLGKNQWYSVRIADYRIPNIKYVACYRGAPYSGITHYAKVKDIKPYKDSGKYIILFDGSAISLTNKVKLGNADVMDVRKLRYTTLDNLKQASEVSDLW